ncbi:restriction endonuclease subunit S [Rhizobium leguminosarum]|uniref:restriction endonuclease subunit S n=1 Tax=Rhizobium leguminosarum TaxID=384 RepID=UPI001032025A|nr:restriction endonuclease subunit S [Rhizobium leguminosarum]TAY24801.1 restriction endonuclease subunit S [Rhizobium leguminosarum]
MNASVARLEDVCEINPRAPKNISDETPVSFLPMSAVSEDGYVAFEEARTYGDVKKGYTYFERGDVLVAKITPCFENGKAASTSAIQNKIGFGSTEFHVLRASPDVDPKYVFYLLWSDRFRTIGEKGMTGSAGQKRVPADLLKRLEIPLPPLSEQKRIAAILDKADRLRQKRRQAIALLDSLTQSIFLEMFGDPVSNPKGWQWSKLGEIGNLDRGVSKHRPRNDPRLLGGAHPLIQTGDVSNSSGYIRAFRSTYSDLGLFQSKMWPAGTLCITIAANIASTGILTFPACFPDSVVGFSSSTPGVSQYVRVWMSFLKKTLETIAPAVAQKNINLAILRELDIPLPSAESLRKFNLAMDQLAIEQEKSRLQKQNSGVLFASLQHRAFSGQL